MLDSDREAWARFARAIAKAADNFAEEILIDWGAGAAEDDDAALGLSDSPGDGGPGAPASLPPHHFKMRDGRIRVDSLNGDSAGNRDVLLKPRAAVGLIVQWVDESGELLEEVQTSKHAMMVEAPKGSVRGRSRELGTTMFSDWARLPDLPGSP